MPDYKQRQFGSTAYAANTLQSALQGTAPAEDDVEGQKLNSIVGTHSQNNPLSESALDAYQGPMNATG